MKFNLIGKPSSTPWMEQSWDLFLTGLYEDLLEFVAAQPDAQDWADPLEIRIEVKDVSIQFKGWSTSFKVSFAVEYDDKEYGENEVEYLIHHRPPFTSGGNKYS